MGAFTRTQIIDIVHKNIDELVSKEVVEKALIKAKLITPLTKEWLKEHYIDKQLSAKECAGLLDVTIGYIQGQIKRYKLTKKKFGITTGNNQAHRRAVWKRNIAQSQPHSKKIKIFHIDRDEPIFIMNSITSAAKKLQIPREHIRDCLNPKKQRKSAYGFRFEYITQVHKAGVNASADDLVKMFKTSEQREKELRQVLYK
jgi:signal recognition particle subunit SEC65/predicted DNA-binding protein YlxM (UPF0122 family)